MLNKGSGGATLPPIKYERLTTEINNQKKMDTTSRITNQMQMYIGKQFHYEYMTGNSWKVTIVGIMDDGYFKTEVEDDGEIWNSNMSYGELRHELKRGTITEIITK